MNQDLELLKKLTDAHGVSGDEKDVMDVVMEELKKQDVAFTQLPFGDVVCGQMKEPQVLLAAHADEVGFQVHKIHADGTLGVTNLGWVKPHMMNETSVYIKTRTGQRVRGQSFARVGMLAGEVPSFADVYVDIGARSADEVKLAGITVGDTGTYQKEFWTTEHTVFASALDNRLGVYGLLMFLRTHKDILDRAAVCFHLHEELDFEGLRGVVQTVRPLYALIVDMFPVQHKFNGNDTPLEVGQGPAVLYQAGRYVIHYPLRNILESLPKQSFTKAIIDTGPIEIEPLAVQGNGRTMATNIFYPVRGYHKSVYTARMSDIAQMDVFLDTLLQQALK